MMRILIEIYFTINAYLLGGFINENKPETLKEWIFYFFIFGAFGTVILMIVYLIDLGEWLDKQLHIKFWFLFMFTKKFTNLNQKQLENVNEMSFITKSIRDRVGRICLILINKRNNYSSTTQTK